HGPNRLRSAERTSAWRILFEQFTSVVIVIMAVAAGLAFVLAHWVEGFAILAVLLVNTGIGFFSEWRAVRTMESLQRTEQRTTVV
ncbi:MAG: hypothetical protein GWN07_06700, partial [Actinobacteria bacterium]|nr:hypothetical protein [Actinomycetota bacterium]NIW26986.1 hypothetical protein [Actinomycetota bacterium]NIX19534.1 hypothetical protein [Actinomycetota bacterium]